MKNQSGNGKCMKNSLQTKRHNTCKPDGYRKRGGGDDGNATDRQRTDRSRFAQDRRAFRPVGNYAERRSYGQYRILVCAEYATENGNFRVRTYLRVALAVQRARRKNRFAHRPVQGHACGHRPVQRSRLRASTRPNTPWNWTLVRRISTLCSTHWGTKTCLWSIPRE